MRIAIDASQIVYEDTGVGNYTRNLTKSLLEISSEHDFILYAGVRKRKSTLSKYMIESPWRRATWKIRPIPPRIASILFNQTSLSIDWIIGNFDIFHASDWTHPSTNKPTITTIHDLVFRKYPDTVDSIIARTQERRIYKAIANTSHIIVDSDSTKKDLETIYNVDPARMTTIHLACEDRFKPQNKSSVDRVKKRYGIEGDYILALSTLEPRKNIQRVVDAFRALKNSKKHENLKLVLAGRHGWGDKLKVTGEDIIIPGSVESLDLPSLYTGASVFVYPSLYEGFGIPVLESMSCGTPVVASNVSSIPEIAGDSGILVDPESVKGIVAGIEKGIRRMSSLEKQVQSQAKKFSWKRTASKTMDIYTKVYEANYQ